jgi:hypothetical protein
MDLEVSFVTILIAAVVSMVVGSIWYGPIFGKKWMEIIGATAEDEAKRKEMQKAAMPLYVIQFVLSLLQVYILANLIGEWDGRSGVAIAFWMWLGFVMPTIAGSSMWNNNPNRVRWAMFLIQSGYQLVMFVIYGWMFGGWS